MELGLNKLNKQAKYSCINQGTKMALPDCVRRQGYAGHNNHS